MALLEIKNPNVRLSKRHSGQRVRLGRVFGKRSHSSPIFRDSPSIIRHPSLPPGSGYR